MALTWAQCKAAINESGQNPGLQLFDRGYNGSISSSYSSDHIEFMVYWSVHNYSASAQTFACTVYLFARKTDSYTSQNDFDITFTYAGNSYTTSVNRTIPGSGSKVRYMGSHTFENLTTDRVSNTGVCSVKIKGDTGSTIDGPYTLSKTLKFSAGEHEAEISSRSTTSLTYRISNLVTNRNFRTYFRWGQKKSTESSYSNLVSDTSIIGPESTATSLTKTFSGLVPCTYYNLNVYMGMYNYNPETEAYNYIVKFDQKVWTRSGYTNALVAEEPTADNKTYTGSTQTGVSGGTGVTLEGTRSATNVGIYEATATPTAQYNWTSTGCEQSAKTVKTYSWKINPKSIESGVTVSLSDSSYIYDGTAKTPTVTVKDTARNANLKSGTDYTVSYSNNTNAGTATVTVTGKGNYTGTKSVTFVINKASSNLAVSPAAMTVKTKKAEVATYTRKGNGEVTALSSNTGTAKVAVSENAITITGVKRGSCTITVNCAASENYNASSKTIVVTVENSVAVRYGTKEFDTVFYADSPIAAIFYGEKEIT